MTPFLIPKQSVNVSPLCSEPASKYSLEEGLKSIFKQAFEFVCQNWSEGHVFFWKLVLQSFIMISKWFMKIPEAKAVSQDSSQFRDYRIKACPLLPNTAAWWAILETQGWNLGDCFFFMFPLHSRLLQTSHRSLIHFRPQCVHHSKEQNVHQAWKESINSHENKTVWGIRFE